MARITPEARRHAARLLKRGTTTRFDGLLDDEELGDGMGDMLSGIPLIGGLLGGGGGKSPAPDASASPAAPSGDTLVAASQSRDIARLPTQSDIRATVQDALAVNQSRLSAAQVAQQQQESLAAEHAQRVVDAITPSQDRVAGGITEQRLQTQATAEHNAIMRREADSRQATERFNTVVAKLAALGADVETIKRKLAARGSYVSGKALDILGGADALINNR